MIVDQTQLDTLHALIESINEDNDDMGDTIKDLRKQLARTCVWMQEEVDSDSWQGECGALWQFLEGGPIENQQNYCPQCGGLVHVVGESNDG